MAIRAEKVERTILRRDGDDLIEHLREAERIETYERARLSALGYRSIGTEIHANRKRVKVTIRYRPAA